MNQAPEMYYQQHITATQPPQQSAVTSGAVTYAHQPPLLPPGPTQYPAPHYSGYPFNGLTSPPNPPSVPNPLSASVLPLPSVANQNYQGFDSTGQIAPPGMKPRVTATLWEDEGSLCFQVEAKGICVARREDNHMINGTKLLNVAGMTRGRRDGILKSEKVRHVVKIGPMHLKGVWIPFERALDFANKEKITELLYPLFVHNIGALLYHPTNQNRTNQVMAAAERRKQEQQNQMRSQHPGPHPGLPSIGHHPMLPSSTPTQQPQPMGPHPMQRPAVDRTQTFPTPPASASSLVDGSGISQSNYQWQQAAQAAPPMSIDTGLSNARSMPTTPATTPPGTTIQSMPQYPAATQSYDGSRQQMYSAPATQQSPYQSTNGAATHDSRSIYAQHGTYVKSEMGPPTAPAGRPVEQQDTKPNGMMHPGHTGGEQHHAGGEEHDEHEHEAEYTHDSTAYDANRGQYNYSAPGGVGSMQGDHAHLSPELTGSPSHQAGSGRATPRTQPAPQPYYGQQPGAGYSTPPRHQQAPGSLYNVVSGGDARGPTNGATGSADVYGTQQDMGSMHHQQNGGYVAPTPQHQQTQPLLNGGSSGGIKRSRDDDEELARPSSGGGIDLKRRKTGGMMDDMNRPGSAIAAAQQRRR